MTDENMRPLEGDTDNGTGNDDGFDPREEPNPYTEPDPIPILEPIPEPAPNPKHDPAPVPGQDDFPNPKPNPVPDTISPKIPVADPHIEDDSHPDHDIEELLRRTKHLEHSEPEKPGSISKKMCPTRHGCQGATDCDSCLGNYPV